MKYILAFDLGTSSCKCVIYDEGLQPVCDATHEYPTHYPENGWSEQSAEQWWDAFCKVAPECLEKAHIKASDLAVVCIDSMGSIALPIDREGNPLYRGLLWMDRRSVDQCTYIDARIGPDLLKITGNRNDPSNIAPKILWFKQKHPDIYKRAWKFLHANGYLVFKLTGVATQDRTECGLTQLYDIYRQCWSPEIFSALDLDMNKLPDVRECDEIVGHVSAGAARQSGLCEGTPVIAGAMDCIASALGTASIATGDVYIAGGTVAAVGIVVDEPHPHKALHLHNHIVPGKYVNVSAVDFGGGGLHWFRDVLEYPDFTELNRLAALAPPGNDGLIFLPYMVGQRSPLYNNNTTGVMFGLTPDHNRSHLVRMFMEGTSYAIRNCLEYFRVSGTVPTSAKLTGGIGNSAVWSQILCDVIGVDIERPAAVDMATLGDAITGAVAIGLYPDYESAASKQNIEFAYKVNKGNADIYMRTFSVFRNLFNNMLFSYEFARNVLNKDFDR